MSSSHFISSLHSTRRPAACVAPWNTFHNLWASIRGVLQKHWKRKEEVIVLIYPPTHTHALWPLSISLSAFLSGTAVRSTWQLPLIRCWWKTQFPRAHCSSAVHPCGWPAGVRPAWHLESAALMRLSCCVTLNEAMQRRPYWYPRRRAEINRPLLCCVCVCVCVSSRALENLRYPIFQVATLNLRNRNSDMLHSFTPWW